ncbi:L-lactate dehydrogenase [Fulvivirga imtechensis AK7]|uniref:L-lactate dehydrogenase n=1 Tax=Fulvivirga imtechensis AK7 TaxID=1237149 RepID=L8K2S3_9BACT|nr:L-lactate dehydrogenase [Fulvivirga imtechensis]ELR73737.1 L-lactate dehydrogenase [Fulvivirga imtechensis AK7]
MGGKSIGIIGMGWVGSSVAISVLYSGIANELLLYDIKTGIAEGEAMDLSHGSSFYPTARVAATTVEEMMRTDAIVVAAGRGGKPGETRLQLLNENVLIAKNIAEKLRGYEGIIIVVSNPVDVLTYFIQKFSGLPTSRVIGTGTMLDTARLKEILGQSLLLDPRSIHAQVIGEHGDSEVVLWSSAMVGGMNLRNWKGWVREKELVISERVRTAAQEIIKRKGATNHAIGLVTATLIKWMLRGERRIINVSRVQEGAMGYMDVAISLPTIVGIDGATEVLIPNMSDEEHEKFHKSVEVIKKAIVSVKY